VHANGTAVQAIRQLIDSHFLRVFRCITLALSRCIGLVPNGRRSPDSRTAVAFDGVCRCLPHRGSSDPVPCIC
jgi:hypothetical protein